MTDEQFNSFAGKLLAEDITPAQIATIVADMRQVHMSDSSSLKQLQEDHDNWKQQATDYALANSKLYSQLQINTNQGGEDDNPPSPPNIPSNEPASTITTADIEIEF